MNPSIAARFALFLGTIVPVGALAQDTDHFNKATIDKWLYGDSAVAVIEPRVRQSLLDELEIIELNCVLLADQRKKLELAGRGDLKGFFEGAEELRTKYVGARWSNRERIADVAAEVKAHGDHWRTGLFQDGSLFYKTLRRNLTEQQLTRYSELNRDSRHCRLEWVLAQWDLRALDIKLTPNNRRKLAALLIDKSNPPTDFTTHTYFVLLLQMKNLETDVLPHFDAAEQLVLQGEMQKAQDSEPTLRKLGAWPVNEVDRR